MRVAADAHVFIAVFIVNHLDRTNVGFAALTMNKDPWLLALRSRNKYDFPNIFEHSDGINELSGM